MDPARSSLEADAPGKIEGGKWQRPISPPRKAAVKSANLDGKIAAPTLACAIAIHLTETLGLAPAEMLVYRHGLRRVKTPYPISYDQVDPPKNRRQQESARSAPHSADRGAHQ
jgi:hypothetical protein